MNNSFSVLSEIIKQRRSTKPNHLNGNIIPDEQIEQLLQLADWAPTHGSTEPWHFFVYGGDAAKAFCQDHADLYRNNTLPEKYLQANYDKLLHNGDKVSHIIVAVMKRGMLPKIPVVEEKAAVAVAIQHILLGATSLGIATLWSTGGMTHSEAMKNYLGLREEDEVMGMLFLGYSDITTEGKRHIPLSEKITWQK